MAKRRMEAGGVRVYEDHRDNLTIDVENALVQDRAAQLRSEDSQSALLWNVFRSLEKIDLNVWLPRFLTSAMSEDQAVQSGLGALLQSGSLEDAAFHWWNRTDLPLCRHEWLREAAMHSNLDLGHYPARYLPEKKAEVRRLLSNELDLEDPVEMPLTIEAPTWILGVLAVYKGNLRQHTCFDAHRDQVLQWLDAGSYHAAQCGKRFLTLVIYTDGRTYNSETRALVRRYQNRPEVLRGRLSYRHDETILADAARWLGDLRWRDIGALLLDTKEEARLGLFDQTILDELVKYLARKDIGFNFFRRLK